MFIRELRDKLREIRSLPGSPLERSGGAQQIGDGFTRMRRLAEFLANFLTSAVQGDYARRGEIRLEPRAVPVG